MPEHHRELAERVAGRSPWIAIVCLVDWYHGFDQVITSGRLRDVYPDHRRARIDREAVE